MLLKELISHLETIAPPALQESYDNSGLIVGSVNKEINAALIALDCIESTIDEAIEKKCDVVVAHHPIVFSGLKRFNGSNYVERTIIKAIKNDIAIYAIHTNLDNVVTGVNAKICEKLQLVNTKILSPKKNEFKKLVVFVPSEAKDNVLSALFSNGAGVIGNYAECSFQSNGTGTYTPDSNSNPYQGEAGKREQADEIRIETIIPVHAQSQIIGAMQNAHPYEEVAFDVYPVEAVSQHIGSGMIGDLENEMDPKDFLAHLKNHMKTSSIRHTNLPDKKIKTVAVCGGSGSFLLNAAKGQKADIFITSDFKYHQFFDAENEIVIADIGHYESEQFTIELLYESIMEKFPKFATHIIGHSTNPVNYF
ncbi:MAG: Nif3-like dinuclear metal center hexameric protein [Bacteroidia bacterium]|nr:Nif3-like dinuclear metal center hexameric protein [Bacteroidia bacterium]